VVHDTQTCDRDTLDEASWTIYSTVNDKKVVLGSRRQFYPCQAILDLGLKQRPALLEFAIENKEHEWALYLSDDNIIFWKDGLIDRKKISQIHKKCS